MAPTATDGDGAVKRIYTPDTPYWPHTTLLLRGTAEEVRRAESAATDFEMPAEFEVSSIELIGRIGPDRGGEYHILESFPFGG